MDRGLQERVRRDQGFKTHLASPTELIEKRKFDVELPLIAVVTLRPYSGGYWPP